MSNGYSLFINYIEPGELNLYEVLNFFWLFYNADCYLSCRCYCFLFGSERSIYLWLERNK